MSSNGIRLNLTALTAERLAGEPLVIAGPCSAETEEQVMACARRISRIPGVHLFRSGIWKPRTRPNCFEGVGEVGLRWLQRVKRETGLKTAVEVAKAEHVRAALAAGIDVLWIGARTTVSPFAVQEIADALEGSDATVLVKNPVNPDLGLWLGALERINRVGITRLGAIHRGFSTYEKTAYRNVPKWDLALALREACPGLPIINDPSHICGKRDMVPAVAQKAMDLGLDGLMIETHIEPDQAWSDAAQQVTPEILGPMLAELRQPVREPAQVEHHLLETLRGEIDHIDRGLIEMISVRNAIAGRIGQYKKDKNLPVLQTNRWREVMEDRLEMAAALGLELELIREIYRHLHGQSLALQSNIR